MKKNIIKIAALALPALLLAACNDNSWNDHELDGFQTEGVTDVQSIKYTLTASDYALLANNATNKALAEANGVADELKAVGTQGFLTGNITAAEYIPALLSDPSFPFFTLSDGSAITLTYNQATEMPPELMMLSNAYEFVISDADYQEAYGSDTNYANAFSPSTPASKYIPKYLANTYDDAQAGDYAIVNMNVSQQDPVFGSVDPTPTPSFTMSNELGSIDVGDDVTVNGVVTATCIRGFILTDNGGSVLVYYGASYDNSYSIGDQVVLNGTVSQYGNGFQIDGTTADVEVVGTQAYTYPTPKVLTGADIEEFHNSGDPLTAVYGQLTATVVVSGSYINLKIDDSDYMGSVYYASDETKALFVDGEKVTVYGYLASKSGAVYGNIIVTKVESAAAARRHGPMRMVALPSTNENQVWYFDGSKWSQPSNVCVLSHADYQAMGLNYDNLSAEQAARNIPIYLKTKFPYATADNSKFVVYKLYPAGATTFACGKYVCDGSNWSLFSGYEEETAQFVRLGGKWMYDPNVTITLPVGKGQALSTQYFQACTDWVFENIDAKEPINSTSITSGKGYVTSYGNNEYYSGCSAYQGNVDLRPSAARTQYPEGYEGMTDEEVVALEKYRFEHEVMPGALSMLHPDAKPIEGMDVYYTINFGVYTGTTQTYTIRFKVVGQGQFEFVDCTWNDAVEQ